MNAVVILLLSIHLLLCLSSAASKSVAFDESVYIATSSQLYRGNREFFSDHGYLGQYLIGGYNLLMDVKIPDQRLYRSWPTYALSFSLENVATYRQITLLARIPVMLLSLLTGFVVFRWAAKLSGEMAGVLALFFYSLSPNLLAHARLATLDLPVTFFITFAAFCLYCAVEQKKLWWLALSGLFAGLGLGIKFSMLLAAPPLFVALGLHLVESGRKRDFVVWPLTTFVCFLFGLWAAYGFGPLFSDGAQIAVFRSHLAKAIGLCAQVIPLPKDFVLQLDSQFSQVKIGGYFNGEISEEGFLLYYPMSLLLKVPLAFLVLTLVGVWASFKVAFSGGRRGVYARWAILAGLPLFFLLANVFFSEKNIGIRYVLPLFPFMALAVGAVPRVFDKWVLAVFCIWFAVVSLLQFPHYISSFNEISGGSRNGSRWFVDSNLDWGQDLILCREYIDENPLPEGEKYNILYFGWVDPAVYLGDRVATTRTKETLRHTISPGRYVVSQTLLHNPYQPARRFGMQNFWSSRDISVLKKLEPIGRIGHSLLVFEVSADDIAEETGRLRAGEAGVGEN